MKIVKVSDRVHKQLIEDKILLEQREGISKKFSDVISEYQRTVIIEVKENEKT